MSTVTRPRGPLPARVYWTRRLVVLVLACLLVLLVGRLLGGGGGGDQQPSAATVGAQPSPTTLATDDPSPSTSATVVPTPSDAASETEKPRRGKRSTPPAVPTGPCADDDVVVSPQVSHAEAGKGATITLQLTTREEAACTWTVSPETVFVKITTADGDPIWSSQDCPAAVPTQDVVPRRDLADSVAMTWEGRRSDATCSDQAGWALAGDYEVETVAAGAVTPVDVEFELGPAVAADITRSPKPHDKGDDAKPGREPSGNPSSSPSGKPDRQR